MIYKELTRTLKFLIEARHRLVHRSFLIDALTIVHDQIHVTPQEVAINKDETVDTSSWGPERWTRDGQTPRKYKLYDIINLGYSRGVGRGVYYVSAIDGLYPKTLTFLEYRKDFSAPLLNDLDGFTLQPGMIENYPVGSPSVVTSVGRFIANYGLLVRPFGDKYPYVNKVFDLDEICGNVATMILDDVVTTEQYKIFVNQMYWMGHFGELCVPTFTEKSFVTDPRVEKRKQELLAQYKGQLSDPDVMTKIEDELIAMDKEFVKGDVTERFLKPLGSRAFEIHRKKMFASVGGIEAFKKGTGDYDFIENSLAQGWDPKNLPVICNEIRKGSYNRGVETQNSGAQTKSLARILQDLRINSEDCQTTEGLSINFGEFHPKRFVGRTVILSNGTQEMITRENATKFLNQKVRLRSPMYCKDPAGYCKVCMGEIFRKLNAESLNFYSVTITSTLMNLAMKAMHGTKLEMVDIDPMKCFVAYPQEGV
jgi:hypothetical protein